MNPPTAVIPIFSRLRFILVETYHPGNVGAVARAMKTMGFSDLVLLNPHKPDVATQEEALAFASNADDVLSGARIVTTFDEAIHGCNLAAALTARPRVFSPPVLTARALAGQLAADPNLHAALVFGSERFGLPNEIIEKCNVLINIPSNPDYWSLNLAQAVQILAYECRLAELGDHPQETAIGFRGQAASVEQIDGMFSHLEEALIALEFLHADNPKKLMPRLRRLFSRAHLEAEEVNILRGIAKQILWKHKK
ncbi:MAG: RNA methyltransferase [Burkholderiaceae bacterium]|nr:RNA methyltransferase [Burkholderiaceae bacterium]